MDAGRVLLPSTVTTTVIEQGAATDVISANVPAFTLTKESHIPDNQSWRDQVIGIDYTAAADCNVIVTVSSTYIVNGTVSAKAYINGAVAVVSAGAGFDGGGISVQCEISGPDYEAKGYFTATHSYAMSAGQTKRFGYFMNYTVFNSETVDLANVYMRLEAVKV